MAGQGSSQIGSRLIKEALRIAKQAEDFGLSFYEVGLKRRAEFQALRQTADYRAVFEKERPLVSILIATYNRGELLRDRAIRSALSQTYPNVEVIVVGDCCTDDTARIVATVNDPRLHFINLPERGRYPAEPHLRWMVAGTTPTNHALTLARGDFITHLDDDDEHAIDRVEKLLDHVRATHADLVFHPFEYELPEGGWEINSAERFALSRVTTSSIFYHAYLATIPWDLRAYRFREPGDWNRLRKIGFLGAHIERHPEPLLKHYRERNQVTP